MTYKRHRVRFGDSRIMLLLSTSERKTKLHETNDVARFTPCCTQAFPVAGAAALMTTGLSAQIFWTNDKGFSEDAVEAGSIWRMELDGTKPREIVGGLNRPIGVAVDAENGFIYWSEDGLGAFGQPSRIRRAKLDGSESTILFDGSEHGFVNAQMIILVGDTLYWTTFAGGVMSGNKDGSGTPVTLGGGAGSAINYTAIGFDETGNHIYYGEPNGSRGLYRMNSNGEDDQLIHSPMAPLDWSFNVMAIDSQNGYIYFADMQDNSIRRRNLDGTNEQIIATDAASPYGLALAEDEIYWTGRGGTLGKVSVEPGSTSTILATELPTIEMFGIAVIGGSERTFASWVTGFEIDPLVSGFNDDADGDGIANGLEYALGGDPSAAASDILPRVETREISGETYLTITYPRRVGGADDENGDYSVLDLTYAVQGASEVGEWAGANAEFVSATADGELEGFEFATHRATTPVSAETRQFLRLQVER